MARDDERDGLEHTGYRSGQVRIVGAEPAGRSAAMRSEDPSGEVWDEEAEENRSVEDGVVTPPLPHWTEPATGEVPAILARDRDEDGADPFASLPGPSWRQDDSDWDAQDEDFEPSMLAGDQTGQGSLDASTNTADRQPWVFELPGSEKPEQAIFGDEEGWDDAGDWEELSLAAPGAWEGEQGEDRSAHNDGPITEVIPVVSRTEESFESTPVDADRSGVGLGGPGAPSLSPEEADPLVGDFAPLEPALVIDDLDIPLDEPRSRFSLRRRPAEPGSDPQPKPERRPSPAWIPRPPRRPAVERTHPPGAPAASQRNVAAAIGSGVVLGGLALITFKIGPAAAVGLVTLVVTLAAAEGYAAFRQGGYHPVTLLGLVATISLMIATYNRGEAALPLVFVLLLAACFVWHLAGVESTDAVRSTGTTLFVFGWVAVFGSFGALLLSPALFPERHGIAFLLGGVIAGVSYDVGALTFGAWLGRHPMSSVSPNKTWEGFVGGLVTSLLLSVVIVHLIHPWTVGKAAVLALVVSVVATLGDLFESTVKRHLGRKDMGRLLPGHGGLLDRVDGLLFVLPATYYLVIAFHLA